MKKRNGYTLAEVLVTLGVVGIIAAITAPLVSKFRPDTDKITFLNTYDMIKTSIDEIVNNPEYYRPNIAEDAKLASYPLLDFENVTVNGTNITGGQNKIARVFEYHTGLKHINDIRDYNDGYAGKPQFITKNGVGIFIETDYSSSNGYGYYVTLISIDLNGKEGPNCWYNDNCKKPDVFQIAVDASGKIRPKDRMTAYYLLTRNSLKKSSINLDDNNEIVDKVNNFAPFTRNDYQY